MDLHPALCTDEAEAGLKSLHADVIGSAGRIIARKLDTNWALVLTVTSIARCILRDERHVLPLSVPAFGKHGIDVDGCLSLPAMLGAEGVLEGLNMPLTEEEQGANRSRAATPAEGQSKSGVGGGRR